MNVFIMYNRHSKPSAKAFVARIKQNTELSIYYGTPKSKQFKKHIFDVVINIGNSMGRSFHKKTMVINRPNYIAESANKKKARMKFKAKQILAPELWLKASDIPAAEFPVIGRTTYHMKARGFWFCSTPKEARKASVEGATHFIKYIDNTREFRAHIFATTPTPIGPEDYIVGKLAEKRPSVQTTSTVIKNYDNGYRFVAPCKKDPHVLFAVRALAKEAIYKFKLHYGGVDIIYSLDRNKVYILEINTTPCLTDENATTLDTYVDKITNMFYQ